MVVGGKTLAAQEMRRWKLLMNPVYLRKIPKTPRDFDQSV